MQRTIAQHVHELACQIDACSARTQLPSQAPPKLASAWHCELTATAIDQALQHNTEQLLKKF